MKWTVGLGLAVCLLTGCWSTTPSIADAASPVTQAWSTSYAEEAEADFNGALAAMDQIPADERDTYLWNLRRGWLLYAATRYGDAVSAYHKAQRASPESVEALVGATLPLMALRRWSEVESSCTKALKLAPGNYLAWSRRGYSRYQMGKYADSASDYAGLVKQYPSDVEMRAGLGWAQLKLGRVKDARATFAYVLRIAPQHASASEGIAASQ